MNAKTYGQIMTESIHEHINERMTSLGYDQSQEKVARAVILEFVRRVEERAAELERSGANQIECGITEKWANLFDAFEQLSTEIKEAK